MTQRQLTSLLLKELKRADWKIKVAYQERKTVLKGNVKATTEVTAEKAEDLWGDTELRALLPLFMATVCKQLPEEYSAADVELTEVKNSRKATGKAGHVTVSVEFDLRAK